MRRPEPVVLTGHGVRLEPLDPRHAPDLLEAAGDPQVWRWLAVQQPVDLAGATRFVERTIAERRRVAFAVVVEGRAVGSTSFLDADPVVGGLEVGWTWYARPVWRTHVNPACKRLLLGHAFDDLGARRVTLKTDALNTRSRSAIARLGAQYDGTLRHAKLRLDGSVRDSAYFSVLAEEWSRVRDGLDARLAPIARLGAAPEPTAR